MTPEVFRADTIGAALALADFGDLGRVLVDTTGAGLAQAATIAELAALARVTGTRSRRTLVVASQISRHGVVVTAVSSGRRLADALVVTGRSGLARRLLAA